jgi:DNA-binding HxlR family transcriptional regulator
MGEDRTRSKDALFGNREKQMTSVDPIRPDDLEPTPMTRCPMTAALQAVGGKWSLICLYFLDTGTRRFNELGRLIPDVSQKVLSETLRNLEEEGLIVRTVHSVAPSHVEYEISQHDETVRPLIHAVRAWAGSIWIGKTDPQAEREVGRDAAGMGRFSLRNQPD